MKHLLISIAIALFIVACGKEDKGTSPLIGTWENADSTFTGWGRFWEYIAIRPLPKEYPKLCDFLMHSYHVSGEFVETGGIWVDAQTIVTGYDGDRYPYSIVSDTILYIETGEDTLKYIKIEEQ